MAQQTINIGITADDGTGDTIRAGGSKINDNFTELYSDKLDTDPGLVSIAALTTAADNMIYTTALDTYAVTSLTAAGRAILDDADASAQRTTLGLAIGTDVQAYDANLPTWPSDVDATEVGYLNGVTSAIQTQLDAKEAADSDILKADTGDVLTAGFTTDVYAHGTVTTGTITPAPTTGEENFQSLTNGGAFTLAPPSGNCTVLLQVTNNSSAGTVTTSGFTFVDGDTISTTDGDDFFFFIAVCNGFSSLTVKALQ